MSPGRPGHVGASVRLRATSRRQPSPALNPDPDHAAPAARPLLLANLLAAVAFGLVTMTLCLPSMQEWGRIFDAGQAEVQLTFSAFVIAFGSAQVIYGPLSDRYGRRRLLLLGYLLAIAGSVAAALAPHLQALVAARMLQGAGAAAGMVIGRAMVQDCFAGPDRARVMAWTGMVLGLCPPTATIVGGYVHVHLGWRANFVLAAVLAAVLLLAGALGLPDARPQDRAGARSHWLGEMLRAYAALARVAAFRAYVAILALCTGAFYAFLGAAPIVLASYGVGPDALGWYIMVVPLAYIAGNFFTSRLVLSYSEARLMTIGQVFTVLGIGGVALLAAGGVHSALAVAGPLILMGLGHGLLMPSTLAGTVGLVPALAGAAAAVAGLAQQLTGALGGYVVGLVEHDGALNLALLMLAFQLTSLTALVVLLRLPRADAGRAAQGAGA